MTGPGTWLRDKAVIAGVGRTAYGKRGEFAERGTLSLATEAIAKACEDAGISPKQVDGWASYSHDSATPNELAPAFGCERVRYAGMAWGGGGAAMGIAFMNAAMAVATRQCDYVVVHRSISMAEMRFGSGLAGVAGGGGVGGPFAFAVPYGLFAPAQIFALPTRRHMALYGTTDDQMAEVAINARLMAANNPDARFRDPLTVDDHHASPMIADPLRLLDCCMESDVAVAVVITSADRAADLPNPPAYLAGVAAGGPYRWGEGWLGGFNARDEDMTSAGQRTIAEDLYRYSGVGPADVDVAMVYDHFTPMVIMGLEDFGFCPKGEGGPFVADGNIRLGGSIPVNTHGGNLAEVYAHGMTHVVEGVRQVRGTSPNPVERAETILVVAGAGPTPSSALMLRR